MREVLIFAGGFLAACLLSAVLSGARSYRPPETTARNETPLLLTWDQCDDFFWPSGGAPDWGCVCKMRPIDTSQTTWDFRTDGPHMPPGITLRTIGPRASNSVQRGLFSKRAAKRDDNVFTLEGFALQRHDRDESVVALADGKHRLARPLRLDLSLESHGLELNCPGGAASHYFEGVAEMINHDYNASTTVCAEIFEVDFKSREVRRYLLQLCATRDLAAGYELTHDYREWGPTGAINRGKPNTRAWVEDMLRRSPFGGRRLAGRRSRSS